MFNALSGRINRRTFIIGNAIAFFAMLSAAALIMIPLAIISIVLNSDTFDKIMGYLVLAIAFPAIFYILYFCMLMVKRAHDIGWPGLLIVVSFFGLLAAGRLFDIYLLNILAILIFLFFCLKPGAKARNDFGPVPRKRFKFENLKVTS